MVMWKIGLKLSFGRLLKVFLFILLMWFVFLVKFIIFCKELIFMYVEDGDYGLEVFFMKEE